MKTTLKRRILLTLCASNKNQNLSTKKIYVQLLDGSTAWAPIDAKRVGKKQYVDPHHLLEFYQGDTVKLGPETFPDGRA